MTFITVWVPGMKKWEKKRRTSIWESFQSGKKGDGDNDSDSPISYWLRDPEDNWFTTASSPTI